MISTFFSSIFVFFLSFLPVIPMPSGLSQAIGWLISVVGYINIFVPVAQLAQIIILIILVRNWNIIMSIFKLVFRFIPFVDGGK